MVGFLMLVVIVAGFFMFRANRDEGIFFAILTVVGTLVAGFGFAAMALLGLAEFWVVDSPVESGLVSLADGSETEGSFFLGSGSIDSEPVFFFYRQDDKGAYRLEHRDADNVSIVETSGQPRMVTYCVDYTRVPLWLSWPQIEEPPNYDDCYDSDPTTFYVPEGSIKSNYILDAQ